MKNYKDYNKTYIGSSDSAYLTLKTITGTTEKLCFGEDGSYSAYVVDDHKGLHGELWKGDLIDITDTAESIVERMTKIIVSREKGIEENRYNEDDEELEID